MTWLDAVSLISSLASLILAIFAIWFAKNSEKTINESFKETQKMMNETYDKTKDVLAEINKKAAIIEASVTNSQDKMMSTLTNLLNETVIPKKADIGEQFGIAFIQQLMSEPEKGKSMMESITQLAEVAEKFSKK